jgi:hypothetical protein
MLLPVIAEVTAMGDIRWNATFTGDGANDFE